MKHKYSIDNNNQLLIKPPKQKETILASGRFSVDKDNRLIYWLNEPASWRKEYSLPGKIIFKGSWELNSNYDLELILDKTEKQFQDDTLVIKGNIISTDRDILVFETKTYDQNGLLHIQLLELSVIWLTNETNRLKFMVKKHPPDILTLEGNWQINQNQQIIYNYEKTDLKTKTKTSHILTFEGYWQISSVDRLTYIFSHSSKSRFDFRVQIESPNLYPQEGVIKYRLGIGLRQTRAFQNKIISLYGAWKFKRKAGLIFEMDYGKDRFQNIEFGTNVHLNKKDEFIFSLTNKRKESLGFNLIFTHKFLKQCSAETFLRLKDILDKKERALEVGVRIPF